MVKELTCVVCPVGCRLRAEYAPGGTVRVSGNACPRGIPYAENEIIRPVRMLTSTVKTGDGRMLPVKSERAVPKGRMGEFMEVLAGVTVQLPVRIGDVVVRDIGGTGIDMVATRGME